jgi:hypothetical protein
MRAVRMGALVTGYERGAALAPFVAHAEGFAHVYARSRNG